MWNAVSSERGKANHLFFFCGLSNGLATIQDTPSSTFLMAPFSLLFHERWPIPWTQKWMFYHLIANIAIERTITHGGKLRQLLGLAWSMHWLLSLPDTAKLPTVGFWKEHAAGEKAAKETSAQRSSKRAATWKCEMHTKYFCFLLTPAVCFFLYSLSYSRPREH